MSRLRIRPNDCTCVFFMIEVLEFCTLISPKEMVNDLGFFHTYTYTLDFYSRSEWTINIRIVFRLFPVVIIRYCHYPYNSNNSMKRARTTSCWQLAPTKRLRIVGTLYMNSIGMKVCCDKGRRLKQACLHGDCKKKPNYGNPLEKRATYCVTHKQDDMKDIVHKRCLQDGCKTRPSYGYPLDRSATYCVTHKQHDMEDIVHKRCLHNGCDTQPSYGQPLDKSATYCATHKQDGMEDIRSKSCLHDGCKIIPKYGNPLDKSAMYCVTHKQHGMENIVSKRCLRDGCETRPSYGRPLDKSATYCVSHKQDGMENIVDKLCL
jgi:hypothetical protein